MAGFICKDPACIKKATDERKRFFSRKWRPVKINNAVHLNRNLCLLAYGTIEHIKKYRLMFYEKEMNPMMKIPEELCLKITEDVLNKLPPGYAISTDSRGHARLFQSGTFTLTKPIPKNVLVKALVAAGYITEDKDKKP